MAADIPATQAIPFAYRFILTTFEPSLAVLGSVTTILNPGQYLDALSRSSVPYDTRTSFLYTELVGAWLLFAFLEGVVLRALDSHHTWRLLCVGMLLSDICYCHSCAEAVGGWAEWVHFQNWAMEEWFVFITTALPVFTRLCIVLGIGVRGQHIKTA